MFIALALLVAHKLPSALLKKKKKVKNFFSAELECGGWDLGLSNFQNPVNSVIKLNLLSPIEDR